MSLAIVVGAMADAVARDPAASEWYAADFARINELLAERGLPAHHEPQKLKGDDYSANFPYSFLHYLRRAYIYATEGKPLPSGEPTGKDEKAINKALKKSESHLLRHSDAEGYYVPIDFAEVIEDSELTGNYLGSSQALLRELEVLRAPLGAPESPPESLLAKWDESDEDEPLGVERMVWAALYRAAQASIREGSAIAFE